ncbi:MAG: hypothetical protein ACP5UN_02330, partial [Candidatus Micrarchaeia archaeon]
MKFIKFNFPSLLFASLFIFFISAVFSTILVSQSTTNANTITISTKTTNPTFSISFNILPSNSGLIIFNNIQYQTNNSNTFILGNYPINAIPNSNFVFSNWSSSNSANVSFENSSAQNTIVAINGNAVITAILLPQITFITNITSLQIGSNNFNSIISNTFNINNSKLTPLFNFTNININFTNISIQNRYKSSLHNFANFIRLGGSTSSNYNEGLQFYRKGGNNKNIYIPSLSYQLIKSSNTTIISSFANSYLGSISINTIISQENNNINIETFNLINNTQNPIVIPNTSIIKGFLITPKIP